MPLFGTSGIRDLSPSLVSPRLAQAVGAFVAQMALADGAGAAAASPPAAPGRRPRLIVGYDGRRTGEMLKAAVASGAACAGADVLDIGLCATPTLASYSAQMECPAVMATASHNPPEYNGLKLFWRGREMPKEKEEEIERQLDAFLSAPAGEKTLPQAEWALCGQIEDHRAAAQEAHLALILSRADLTLVKKKAPLVVVDCANASACALTPRLLAEAGCRVVALNAEPGEPYGRGLEPEESNLAELSEEVRRTGALLGLAHDGDADRVVAVDERGRYIGLDVQLAMVVEEQLRRARTDGPGVAGPGADPPPRRAKAASGNPRLVPLVVSTVESSLALRELVERAGGRLEITPVGSLRVAQAMRAGAARFGGEPCGEYVFSDGVDAPDGLRAGLFLVELACRRGPLSQMAAAVARYPVGREKIPCPNGKKAAALAAIAKKWPFPPPSTLDGLRSDLPHGWVLVRPSGTEPYMRITAEARSAAELAKLLALIRPVVEKACG